MIFVLRVFNIAHTKKLALERFQLENVLLLFFKGFGGTECDVQSKLGGFQM
jgi:hypothetical protein